MSLSDECNVTYELVKPEELNPKERAIQLVNNFWFEDTHIERGLCIRFATKAVNTILALPLIGTGRMQPESFEDLKYWKEVLNELEKM